MMFLRMMGEVGIADRQNRLRRMLGRDSKSKKILSAGERRGRGELLHAFAYPCVNSGFRLRSTLCANRQFPHTVVSRIR
jgi:hypothetical protein